MAYKDHACQDKKIRTCDMARLNTDFQNFFFLRNSPFLELVHVYHEYEVKGGGEYLLKLLW